MAHIFISYSRKDRSVAHRYAEAFRALGMEVWWDTVLRSGEAYDEVTEQALREAGAVVVLWSKNSVGSRWVRAEATRALRAGTMIPVMIEDCERPVMFELTQTADLIHWRGSLEDPALQALAADVRQFLAGDRTSLGGAANDVAQALARRRRRRLLIGGSLAAGVLALAAAFVTLQVLDAGKVTHAYCAGVGESWGAPRCVGQMSEAEAQKQNRVWRIAQQGGRAIELARIDGYGVLRADPETEVGAETWNAGAARFVYSYQDGGAVSKIGLYSPYGKRLREQVYTFDAEKGAAVVRFESDLGQAELQFGAAGALSLASEDVGSISRSTIGQHRVRYDGAGRVLERRFEATGGGPRQDALGSYGIAYSYTGGGLVESVRNLDAVGDTLVERTGVARLSYRYDEHARLVEVRWLSKAQDPAANAIGFATLVIERDADGRIAGMKRLNEVGQPAIDRQTGVHAQRSVRDARGAEVSLEFLGLDGRAVVGDGQGAATIKRDYDASGNVARESYFDIEGKPVARRRTGGAVDIMTYDERGLMTRLDRLDADGQPIEKSGLMVSTFESAYDDVGNLVREAFFDSAHAPALHPLLSAASVDYLYDQRGRRTEVRFYGLEGEPVKDARSGAHGMRYNYDQRGNLSRMDYVGTDNAPVLSTKYGCASLVYDTNDVGYLEEVRCLGLTGRPAVRTDTAYAVARNKYDALGNLSEIAYFDADGAPTLDKKNEIARFEFDNDERGRAVGERFYGVDGKLKLKSIWGYAGSTTDYDENGYRIAQTFLGVDGKPIMIDRGYARVEADRDAVGRPTAERYYGIDGKPVNRAPRVADEQIEDLYYGLGNVVFSGLYTEAEYAAALKGPGYTDVRQSFNATGEVVERHFYGTDGKPAGGYYGYAVERVEYDMIGRPVLFSPEPFGIEQRVRVRFTYEGMPNHVSRIDFVSADGKIVEGARGFATVTLGLDASGRLQFEKLLAADGKVLRDLLAPPEPLKPAAGAKTVASNTTSTGAN